MTVEIIPVAAVFIIVFVWKAMVVVPQGYVFVVSRLGQDFRVLEPGLNVILPFIETIMRKISMQEMLVEFSAEASTQDHYQFTFEATLNYQVTDPLKASLQVSDYEVAVQAKVKEIMQLEFMNLTQAQLQSDKEKLIENTRREAKKTVSKWGVKITNISLKAISKL